MIKAKIIQNVQGLINAGYQYIEDNIVIGEAHIDYNVLGAQIYFELDNRKYYMKYDKDAGLRYYNIYDEEGNHLGNFERKLEKECWFKNGFYYTIVNMNKKCYHIYAVGKGRDGIHYPCHYQETDGTHRQVALVRKDPVVHNLKDVYDCYLKNKDDRLLMFFYTVYNDFWAFRKTANIAKNSKETSYVITTNKKLKALCDPDFLKND